MIWQVMFQNLVQKHRLSLNLFLVQIEEETIVMERIIQHIDIEEVHLLLQTLEVLEVYYTYNIIFNFT